MTKHPLLNANSAYYNRNDKSAIQILEEALNWSECVGYARGNIIKYEYRKEHKGQLLSDLKKIETYNNYLDFLIKIEFQIKKYCRNDIRDIEIIKKSKLSRIYKFLDIEMDYTL